MGTSNLQILKRETLVEMLKIEQKCGYGYLAEYTGSPWEINERHSYLVICVSISNFKKTPQMLNVFFLGKEQRTAIKCFLGQLV